MTKEHHVLEENIFRKRTQISEDLFNCTTTHLDCSHQPLEGSNVNCTNGCVFSVQSAGAETLNYSK